MLDKAVLGSVNEAGHVCLWSVESQRLLHQFSPSHTSTTIYASFFLCVDEDAGHSCSLTVLHSNVGIATDLCFAPSNNKLLVSVGQDSKIRFQDVHQRKLVV